MARVGLRWSIAALVLGSLLGCEGLLGPEFSPQAAYVAVQLPSQSEDAGPRLSRVGPVEIPSGQTVQLHAVLVGKEAEETVYYTSAQRLEIDDSPIPAEALRPWPDRAIRCLWQTLEVSAPLLEASSEEQLDGLQFTNFSHPDWGLDCSAIATITARQRDTLTVPDDAQRLAFGVHNYQVWIEVFKREGDLVAEQAFKSAGSSALLENPENAARAFVGLDDDLARAKRVFGLSQIEPQEQAPQAVRQRIADLHQRKLLFSRELLFAELAAEAPDGLDWQLIETSGVQAFSAAESDDADGVKVGDLLRIGNRFVVLFRDVGVAGVLDPADLCFDYSRGAIVRRLGDVFVGDEDGDVEWAAR